MAKAAGQQSSLALRPPRQRPTLQTANVLNKLPNAFVETWGVKYDRAVECLTKDRDALLAFYDFPAAHWKHLRTTNIIESAFATIRHRTVRSKGCLSNRTALAMIYKLAEAAGRSGSEPVKPRNETPAWNGLRDFGSAEPVVMRRRRCRHRSSGTYRCRTPRGRRGRHARKE